MVRARIGLHPLELTKMRQIDDHFVNRSPNTLYHYTGFSSLRGIVQGKSLWVGSVHYMNDAMELWQALDGIDYLLEPQIAFGGSSPRTLFSHQFKRWIGKLRGDLDKTLFIFSLSEAESILSQWRSYTPHGKGVSIGFSRGIVDRLLDVHKFKLGKCVYDPNDQQALLHALVEKLWSTCQNGTHEIFPTGAPTEIDYSPVFEKHASDIYQVLALVKNQAFEEEREWRLISPLHFDLANCDFREGESMMVPYLTVSLGKEQVKFDSVLLGPTPHSKLSVASLIAYLAKEGACTNVGHCEIPYREW